MTNRLNRVTARYAYVHPDRPEEIALWQMRLERIDGSTFDGRKTKQILYRVPVEPGNNDPYRADTGKPPAELADRCLYRLPELRAGLAARVPAVFWTEGEKDCTAADELLCDDEVGTWIDPLHLVVAAVCHHGGAGKSTPQQAEHFRGYGGLVYVAVDWDEAGAACGLQRYHWLRNVGVRAELVRPADGALDPSRIERGGRGNSGADRFALEEEARERGLHKLPGGGADLTDHVDAGYALRDLVTLAPADLAAAAARAHNAWAGGASVDGYGGAENWEGSVWADEAARRRGATPTSGSVAILSD